MKMNQFPFNQVRMAGTDENPIFCAADVCKILGILDSGKALSELSEDEKGKYNFHTARGIEEMLTVSEPGLYHLILQSDTPAAQEFQKWVFSVLEVIAQTGHYNTSDDTAMPTFLRKTR